MNMKAEIVYDGAVIETVVGEVKEQGHLTKIYLAAAKIWETKNPDKPMFDGKCYIRIDKA